jgi:hypothetical protein
MGNLGKGEPGKHDTFSTSFLTYIRYAFEGKATAVDLHAVKDQSTIH